jgi:molybdopterin converting factor small subunit
MSVAVRLPTVLRAQVGGQAVVELDGATIGEVLTSLVGLHPGLSGQIISTEGELNKFVNIYINDDDVRYLEQLNTPVKSGDEISILPAVAGGSK